MSIPVILLFIDDHIELLSHGIVDALYAAVAVRMTRACRWIMQGLELVHSVRQLGGKLKDVVGVETNGTSPKRDVRFHHKLLLYLRL